MLPHLSGVPHLHVKQALRRALLEPALNRHKVRGLHPITTYTGRLHPKRGTIFRLQVYQRVRKYMKGYGN